MPLVSPCYSKYSAPPYDILFYPISSCVLRCSTSGNIVITSQLPLQPPRPKGKSRQMGFVFIIHCSSSMEPGVITETILRPDGHFVLDQRTLHLVLEPRSMPSRQQPPKILLSCFCCRLSTLFTLHKNVVIFIDISFFCKLCVFCDFLMALYFSGCSCRLRFLFIIYTVTH